jgi:chitin disaccharide deacetylase
MTDTRSSSNEGGSAMATPNTSQTNRLLGYPADARLLLVNADDFGMCHAVTAAIIRTLQEGIVKSCSIMVPCPWSLHALTWLRATPAIRVGVHLTVTSEQPTYRWGPVLGSTELPSLVDETGYFYPLSRVEEFLEQVDLAELEREYRAQIERVFAAGVQPTHLDSHCGIHIRRESICAMTLGLAQEYGLALRVYDHPFIEQLQQQGYPTNDHRVMDSYDLPISGKSARYAAMLRALPVGLSEWAVHPGLESAELQAVEPQSWQVRQTDYQFVMSPEAQAIVQEEGIILVDYTAVQALWNAKSRG